MGALGSTLYTQSLLAQVKIMSGKFIWSENQLPLLKVCRKIQVPTHFLIVSIKCGNSPVSLSLAYLRVLKVAFIITEILLNKKKAILCLNRTAGNDSLWFKTNMWEAEINYIYFRFLILRVWIGPWVGLKCSLWHL